MNKPCTRCRFNDSSHARYPLCTEIRDCPRYKKYNDYLESKRMYKVGCPILSVYEFEQYIIFNHYVFWNQRLWHTSAIMCLQYRTLRNIIQTGLLYSAVKKDTIKKYTVTFDF